jgi:hypothetical protein
MLLELNGTGGVHGSEDLDWIYLKKQGLAKELKAS